MKRIPLNGKRGGTALVDDEDYEELAQYSWHHNNKGYPTRYSTHKEGHKCILMHRVIMKAKPNDGKIIDHIDRNKLNNQKSNLRFCTTSINILNSKIYANNTSGFKGVNWHKKQRRWYARIWIDKKLVYLGKYADKQSAIDARQAFTG